MMRVHQVRTLLVKIRHVEPDIWRRIRVNADITLRGLHNVLQAAFGWTDAHLHEFEIGDVTYAMGDNASMLPLFEKADDVCDDRQARLSHVVGIGQSFLYRYDFVDGWLHDVLVEEEEQIQALPLGQGGSAYVLAGQRACPLENLGGPYAYQEFVRTLNTQPDGPHSLEQRLRAGEDFDAELFDRHAANAALVRLWCNGWIDPY